MDIRFRPKRFERRAWRGLRMLIAAWFCACHAFAFAQQPLAPEIESFIGEMVQKHRFESDSLRRLFAQVQPRPEVIEAMLTPFTARPWYEFRSRYVNEARIRDGARFWREHAATLRKARRRFGVPEEIIVATLGAESFYGRRTGTFPVLEALTMLAFNYAPRAELFRAELEEYLLLAREARFDAMQVKGSYAGAIGLPQFLPSSYRRYAVDFDGDGRRDLVNSVADAIGSVANYYKTFGWRAGEAIAVPAEVDGGAVAALTELGVRPRLTVGALKRRGVTPAAPLQEETEAAVFAVETENGPRYWLGLHNFYVILRYNRSVNYALAIDELARELRAQFTGGQNLSQKRKKPQTGADTRRLSQHPERNGQGLQD